MCILSTVLLFIHQSVMFTHYTITRQLKHGHKYSRGELHRTFEVHGEWCWNRWYTRFFYILYYIAQISFHCHTHQLCILTKCGKAKQFHISFKDFGYFFAIHTQKPYIHFQLKIWQMETFCIVFGTLFIAWMKMDRAQTTPDFVPGLCPWVEQPWIKTDFSQATLNTEKKTPQATSTITYTMHRNYSWHDSINTLKHITQAVSNNYQHTITYMVEPKHCHSPHLNIYQLPSMKTW